MILSIPRSRLLALALYAWLAPCGNIAAKELSLNKVIDLTLRRHPDLRVFELRQQQLQGARQSAALKPALEMELEVENFAGNERFKFFDSAETTIALSSVIELGDQRRHRVNAVDTRKQLIEVEQQIQALELMAETTRRFVNLLAAQAHRQLAVDAQSLAENALQAVRRRVKEGASPRAEQLRADAALAQASLAIVQADSDVAIAKLRLVEMWAGNAAELDGVNGDLLQLPKPQVEQEFVARLQNNVHMQRLAEELVIRQAEVNLAKANAGTDVRWKVGVKQFQESDESALVAGVSVPLFSGRRHRGDIVEAQAKLTEAQVQRQAAQLRLRTHLLTLLAANRTHYAKVNRLRDEIIPLLQQAREDAESAYRRGLYGYLELVAARQDLLQAQSNLIDTSAEALRLQAEIEQLIAEPLSLPDPTNQPATAPEVTQ